MSRFLRLFVLSLGLTAYALTTPAHAQSVTAKVVQSCSQPNLYQSALGQFVPPTIDINGVWCGSVGSSGGGGSVTQGTSPWVDNITQWASTAVGAPTAYGTAPTGNAPGVNAFVTNFPTTQAVSWTNQTVAAMQSGTWSVSISNFPSTQAVSGTVTANLGTLNGAATAGNQTNVQSAPGTGASTLLGIQGASGGVPVAVSWTGQTVGVTGSVTANQGTPVSAGNAWPTYLTQGGAVLSSSNPVPISAGTLPLPAGAATAANQNSTAAGTSATNAQGVQGVAGGVPLLVQAAFAFPVTAGQYTGTLNNSGVGVGYLQMDKRQLLKNSETGSDDPLVGISDTPTQAGTSNVAKAAAGNLYTAQAVAVAISTGQEYLVTINASAVPAAGAAITPLDVVPIGSGNAVIGNTAAINYAPGPPEAFSTGIVALVTTTLTTYTAGGNAFIKVRVR